MPAFNSTTPNLNWAVNRLNHQGNIFTDLLKSLGASVDGLLNGFGSQAKNIVIEYATSWAIQIANDNTHGYDQKNRQGPDYDCSSLVSNAYHKINGIDVNNSTRTMRDNFKANGFTEYPFNGFGECERGDVLWKTGHTAIYCGNNQLVEANINEKGTTTGGRTGDQTGNEIRVTTAYSGWTYYLRFTGGND